MKPYCYMLSRPYPSGIGTYPVSFNFVEQWDFNMPLYSEKDVKNLELAFEKQREYAVELAKQRDELQTCFDVKSKAFDRLYDELQNAKKELEALKL